MVRVLGAIERGGNKMPHPAILFLWLCVGVIVLSVVLAWADVKVTYEVAKPPPIAVEENLLGGSTQPSGGLPDASIQEGEYEIVTGTASIESLLSADGIRFLFTSFVSNFRNFAAVAIILVVMIGVGLAEASGLIGALIRKLVAVSSEATLTPFIVFIGILSSVASDAGYLVLIPLGAAAFKSVGRNPLAGMAAAFAGVAAGFGVNFLITPLDGVLTEITNDSIALVDPDRSIDLAANLYFGIALDDPADGRDHARRHARRRAEPRPPRPLARERRRVARRRQGARGLTRGGGEGPALRARSRQPRCWSGSPCSPSFPTRRCATLSPATSSATRRSWTA